MSILRFGACVAIAAILSYYSFRNGSDSGEPPPSPPPSERPSSRSTYTHPNSSYESIRRPPQPQEAHPGLDRRASSGAPPSSASLGYRPPSRSGRAKYSGTEACPCAVCTPTRHAAHTRHVERPNVPQLETPESNSQYRPRAPATARSSTRSANQIPSAAAPASPSQTSLRQTDPFGQRQARQTYGGLAEQTSVRQAGALTWASLFYSQPASQSLQAPSIARRSLGTEEFPALNLSQGASAVSPPKRAEPPSTPKRKRPKSEDATSPKADSSKRSRRQPLASLKENTATQHESSPEPDSPVASVRCSVPEYKGIPDSARVLREAAHDEHKEILYCDKLIQMYRKQGRTKRL